MLVLETVLLNYQGVRGLSFMSFANFKGIWKIRSEDVIQERAQLELYIKINFKKKKLKLFSPLFPFNRTLFDFLQLILIYFTFSYLKKKIATNSLF